MQRPWAALPLAQMCIIIIKVVVIDLPYIYKFFKIFKRQFFDNEYMKAHIQDDQTKCGQCLIFTLKTVESKNLLSVKTGSQVIYKTNYQRSITED